jgi:hypothetical protein
MRSSVRAGVRGNVAQTARKLRQLILVEMDEHPASEMKYTPYQAEDCEKKNDVHPAEVC